MNAPGPTEGLILIGDDNIDDAALTEAALVHAQITAQVRIAHDGQEVLGYLRGTGRFSDRGLFPLPSLLLLDLHMPRMNGLQAVAAIRSMRIFDSLPIVIVSASDLADNVANSYSAGANEFIYKTSDFVAHRTLIADAVSFWLTPHLSPWLRRPPRGIHFWNPDASLVPIARNPLALARPA